MKNNLLILGFISVILTGCVPTRIVTYSPRPSSSYYATTITPARSQVTKTVAQVYSQSEDISLNLDLQAVSALFCQSSSVREFEQLLNSSSYPVSNLDLNGDGYIDYLRVLETVQGFNHIYLIQAVLADDVYQDVATLIAEVPNQVDFHVEIIGAPFIYGPNFIIRPTFILRPHIFDIFFRPGYTPWHSPWYWDHFPGWYRHPAPIYLNHYQAYIETYMGSHRYCREMSYPREPHYRDYDRMTREYQRNDYGSQHPDRSFSARNANTPMVGGQQMNGQAGRTQTVRNAYDIRMNNESSKVTTSTEPPVRGSSSVSRSNSQNGRVDSKGGNYSGQSRGASANNQGVTSQSRSSSYGINQSGGLQRSNQSNGSQRSNPSREYGNVNGNQNQNVNGGHSATPQRQGVNQTEPAKQTDDSRTVVRSRVNSSGSSSTNVSRTRASSPNPSTSVRESSATKSSSSSSYRSSSEGSATRSSSGSRSTSGSSSSNSNVTRGTRR